MSKAWEMRGGKFFTYLGGEPEDCGGETETRGGEEGGVGEVDGVED